MVRARGDVRIVLLNELLLEEEAVGQRTSSLQAAKFIHLRALYTNAKNIMRTYRRATSTSHKNGDDGNNVWSFIHFP